MLSLCYEPVKTAPASALRDHFAKIKDAQQDSEDHGPAMRAIVSWWYAARQKRGRKAWFENQRSAFLPRPTTLHSPATAFPRRAQGP
jgi:hypothetical protein